MESHWYENKYIDVLVGTDANIWTPGKESYGKKKKKRKVYAAWDRPAWLNVE